MRINLSEVVYVRSEGFSKGAKLFGLRAPCSKAKVSKRVWSDGDPRRAGGVVGG